MQWSLFLLVLMGQCFFSSCRLYEYHLIEEAKTWIEAQRYCREHHSDLATVTDMADTQTLKKMMREKKVPQAWIGLQSHKGKDNRKWHWSLPGVESNETQFEKHWKSGQPNDGGQSTQNCAQILKDSHKWNDGTCGHSFAFICYNDADQNDPFKVVDTAMTWTQAQKYCRKNHTDLISGLDQLEKFSKASGFQFDKLWIGLFRDTWRWSDRSNSSFRNWRFGKFKNGIRSNECATVTNTSGQWNSTVCTETKPFFCNEGQNVSCLPRQYHYVAESLTWTEAQAYCRQTYTDLATIESHKEMKQVNKTVLLSGLNSEVWIGLYVKTLWKWSDNYTGSGVQYIKWGSGQPDDQGGNDSCVFFDDDGFHNAPCSWLNTFFCYRGSQQDPEFVFQEEKMNWFNAQSHCRENYIDLATLKTDAEIQKIQSLRPSGYSSWIGLYKDPHDSWSDGSSSEFRHWDDAAGPSVNGSDLCGVADLESSGKWRLLPCGSRFPFVCYSVPQPGIKRQVIKLRMRTSHPSLDLNDPAVKAQLLKQLQDKLEQSGLSGVTLRWREQPDGKVFHKEEGTPQRKNRQKTEL